MNSPSSASATRLPLHEAFRLYWKYMIGIAAFPPVFIIGPVFIDLSQLPIIPLFFAVSLLALWPYFAKKAPYSLWLVAMAIWMISGTSSFILRRLLGTLGFNIEG